MSSKESKINTECITDSPKGKSLLEKNDVFTCCGSTQNLLHGLRERKRRNSKGEKKFGVMSSIISNSYSLIDSLHSSLTMEDQQNIQKYIKYPESEPFISSLKKSIDILEKQSTNRVSEIKKDNKTFFQKILSSSSILYLSIFSILGAALREFLGRLFGGDCDGVESPWLHFVTDNLNTCITSSDGALFIDLPSNMLGSFLMGLLLTPKNLGLLSNSPIAFLNSKHWFQSWYIVHLGLRTGFCGSLTTFASWNTQMVAIISGTSTSHAHFFKAMFGYIIGVETALASLSLGRSAAIWTYRYLNPNLAREEDLLMFAYSKSAELDEEKQLSNDYEIQYLESLLPKEQLAWAKQNIEALEDLKRWEASTVNFRSMSNDLMIPLREIERKIIIDGIEDLSCLGENLLQTARKFNWDIRSLQNFARKADLTFNNANSSHDKTPTSFFTQTCFILIPILLAFLLLLSLGLSAYFSQYHSFYRTLFLSAFFAPFGTLLRWKLTSLNGKSLLIFPDWFPLGTYCANIFASIISILAKSLLDSPDLVTKTFMEEFLYAIKGGFAGSMSTVSTFVVEGFLLQKSFPHHAKSYYYVIGTIASACFIGFCIFYPIARV